MNFFDLAILEFFNGFSQKSWTFDTATKYLAGANFAKGGVIFAVIWGLWFTHDKAEVVAETRRKIMATIAGSFLALFAARFLALSLPFRYRPLHQAGLAFLSPSGTYTGALDGWSSFPSDHAALFAGLATGIFLISRSIGIASILYSLIIILLPRIYLGLHYPTDILAGIFLGCACVLLTNLPMIKKPLTGRPLVWSEKHPQLFYSVSFLLSYQIVNLFDDLRRVAKFLFKYGS